MFDELTQLTYLVSTALFIFSLQWMSDPEIINFNWIAVALALGVIAGIPLSWVPLTAVPQRTALSHAFGGLAAALVGTAKYYLWVEQGHLTRFRMGAIALEVILGFMTLTGSLIAAGKLQEVLPTRPIMYRNQNLISFTLLGVAILIAILLIIDPA